MLSAERLKSNIVNLFDSVTADLVVFIKIVIWVPITFCRLISTLPYLEFPATTSFFSLSIIKLLKDELTKLFELKVQRALSSIDCDIVQVNWVPSLFNSRLFEGHSITFSPFIISPVISTVVLPLYWGVNEIVTVVPFTETNPIFTWPKEEGTELPAFVILPKVSFVE